MFTLMYLYLCVHVNKHIHLYIYIYIYTHLSSYFDLHLRLYLYIYFFLFSSVCFFMCFIDLLMYIFQFSGFGSGTYWVEDAKNKYRLCVEDIHLLHGTKIHCVEAPASSKTRKVIRSAAAKVPWMVKGSRTLWPGWANKF